MSEATGRLNIFQRVMLIWNDLHPYNAVHTVEIPGRVNIKHLRQVIETTLETLGLTGLCIDRASATFEYSGGQAAVDIAEIEGGQDAQSVLSQQIHRQLDTEFKVDGMLNPFRFFVIRKTGAFHLGVAYCHVVAGAESIALLMRDLASAYTGSDDRGLTTPLNPYPPTYGPWLRRHPMVLLRKLLNLPGQIWNLKHSWRPRYKDEMDTDNGFSMFSLDTGQLGNIIRSARSWEVKVNDVLLALLLKSLIPLEDHRVASSRRNRLSIGTIVNIRRDMAIDSRHTFGVFLGSFAIHHKVPPGIQIKDLAREVRQQTGKVKRGRLFMGNALDLASSIRTLSLLNTERKKKFYQKHYPLSAGVTNMNLNQVWPQTADGPSFDYVRAVSTGPATPLVMSFTTVRDIANISISYRSAVYTPADIQQFTKRFTELLEHLESAS